MKLLIVKLLNIINKYVKILAYMEKICYSIK